MALADLNGNGELDYSEWLLASSKRNELLNEPRLKQAFDYFDKDKSGTISLDELKSVLGETGLQSNEELDQGVWEDILAEADENGDGEIDFQEFKNMMNRLITKPQAENGVQIDPNAQNGQISSVLRQDPKPNQGK